MRGFSPLPKVSFTIGFLILAVSVPRHALGGAVLFALVPFALARSAGLPVPVLLRRTLLALPFVLCAGAANLFLEPFPNGAVSLLVLVAKAFATVGIVLALSASTPIPEISSALTRLHVPCVLVIQIQLLFRYLSLVAEEARNITNAYRLRNPAVRLIPVRDWGVLTGRLFLRTVDRANAVYRAMQCRLFHAGRPLPKSALGTTPEWCAAGAAFAVLLILRSLFA